MRVLCVNSGSSSLKLAVFDVDQSISGELVAHPQPVERARTLVERVGRGGPADITAALDLGLDHLATAWPSDDLGPIDAVSHRIVHGGPHLTSHRIADDEVRAELESAVTFAPLHLPAELAALDACTRRFPTATQVACLDTAFHAVLPELSWRLPIPDRFTDAGIRRYGFHGINCEHVVDALGPDLRRRVVIAHLGSGASCTAVLDGRSVATSMGLTPTGGIVMGTRTGDLDPGVLLHLMRNDGLDADGLEHVLDHESGLLALSGGRSNDVRDLLAADDDDERARLAIGAFVQSIATTVAAQSVVLGGLHTVVFTGGVGEHQPTVRTRVTELLGAVLAPYDTVVVAADEERVMARHAASRSTGG